MRNDFRDLCLVRRILTGSLATHASRKRLGVSANGLGAGQLVRWKIDDKELNSSRAYLLVSTRTHANQPDSVIWPVPRRLNKGQACVSGKVLGEFFEPGWDEGRGLLADKRNELLIAWFASLLRSLSLGDSL